MNAIGNKLNTLRDSMSSLASCMNENMRKISSSLRAKSVTPLGLWHAKTMAIQSTNNCYSIMACGPLANDLHFTLHSIRVIHDYERVDELLHALATRDLAGLPSEITTSLADCLDLIIVAHSDFMNKRLKRGEVESPINHDLAVKMASKNTKVLVAKFLEGSHKSEDAVEVVLACRHLDRIYGLIKEMDQEIA